MPKKHLLFASIHTEEDSCPDENRTYELRVAAGAVKRAEELECAIEKFFTDEVGWLENGTPYLIYTGTPTKSLQRLWKALKK